MPKHSGGYHPAYHGQYVDPNFPDRYTRNLIRTKEDMIPLVRQYMGMEEKIFSFDFESSGLDIEMNSEVCGASFCFDGYNSYYLPIDHKLGENGDMYAFALIIGMVYAADDALVFNAEFEYRCLRSLGYDIKDLLLFDLIPLIWNADTNVTRLNLKGAEKDILAWDRPDFVETFGKGITPDMVTPEETYDYAGFDAISPFLFYHMFSKTREDRKNIIELDQKLIKAVISIEDFVFEADVDLLKEYRIDVVNQIEDQTQTIYQAVGYEFNINSRPQLSDALEKMGIDTGERTKAGKLKTGADLLKKIAGKFPFVKDIISYGKLKKLLGTYIDRMIKEADRTDNQLRFKYFTSRVPSARLAAGGDKLNDFYTDMNIQAVKKPAGTYYQPFKRGCAPMEGIDSMGYTFVETVAEPDIPGTIHRPDLYDNEAGLLEAYSSHNNIRAALKIPDDRKWVSCDFCLHPDTIVEATTGRFTGEVTLKALMTLFKKGTVLVKTPFGFKEVTRVMRTAPLYSYRILTKSGKETVCSHNHRWLVWRDHHLQWMEADDITEGDTLFEEGKVSKEFQTSLLNMISGVSTWEIYPEIPDNGVTVFKIERIPARETGEMIDITVKDVHCFYADGIVSHNSGQELRLAGIFANEPVLLEAFANDEDIHGRVAKEMGVERKIAKAVNFLSLYGGNEYTLSKQLDLPIDQAEVYYNAWWDSMPMLKQWAAGVIAEAQRTQQAVNYFGRVRPLAHWYNSYQWSHKGYADRSAVNHVVQSTAGDLMRICIVRFYEEYYKTGQLDFAVISSIHDELNFAIAEETLVPRVREIQDKMEFQMQGWPIKLTLGIEVSDGRWGRCFPFRFEGDEFVPDVK